MARASLCVAAKGSRCPKPSHLILGRAGFVGRFFPKCFVRGHAFAPGAARLRQAIVSAGFHSTLVVLAALGPCARSEILADYSSKRGAIVCAHGLLDHQFFMHVMLPCGSFSC